MRTSSITKKKKKSYQIPLLKRAKNSFSTNVHATHMQKGKNNLCMALHGAQIKNYAFTSINISDRLVFVDDIECNSNICSVAILCFMRIFYLGNTQYFLCYDPSSAANKKKTIPTKRNNKKVYFFLHIALIW